MIYIGKLTVYEDIRSILAVCGERRLHKLELGKRQGRTRVTERDAKTNVRMSKRRGDWNRAKLILKVETTNKCGRMNVPVDVLVVRYPTPTPACVMKIRLTHPLRPACPNERNRLCWFRIKPTPAHACSRGQALAGFGANGRWDYASCQ